MLATLRNRDFARLWFGGLVSMTGSWMLRVALPVYIFQETGSTLATSLMFIAGALPDLFLGSVAGVFVDRWSRKRTLVVANILLALSVLPLLLAPITGDYWLVYVSAFVQSAVGQFVAPAENALLPNLVGAERLNSANALNALNNNLARLIGPALGGLVMGRWGLAEVVVADALSFAIASLLIAGITLQERPRTPSGAAASVWSGAVREWLDGLGFIKRQRTVRILVLTLALTALGEGVMSVLFVPFVTEVLRGEALQLGWLLSAQAVGGIGGGLVIGALGSRVPPVQLLGYGSIIFGLIDLAIFNYPAFLPGITPALLLMVLVGFPAAGFGAGALTLLQTEVADAYRGRVLGAYGTLYALVLLLGMATAGSLGDELGIVPVINVQGYVYITAGILVLTLLSRRSAESAGKIPRHGQTE